MTVSIYGIFLTVQPLHTASSLDLVNSTGLAALKPTTTGPSKELRPTQTLRNSKNGIVPNRWPSFLPFMHHRFLALLLIPAPSLNVYFPPFPCHMHSTASYIMAPLDPTLDSK